MSEDDLELSSEERKQRFIESIPGFKSKIDRWGTVTTEAEAIAMARTEGFSPEDIAKAQMPWLIHYRSTRETLIYSVRNSSKVLGLNEPFPDLPSPKDKT